MYKGFLRRERASIHPYSIFQRSISDTSLTPKAKYDYHERCHMRVPKTLLYLNANKCGICEYFSRYRRTTALRRNHMRLLFAVLAWEPFGGGTICQPAAEFDCIHSVRGRHGTREMAISKGGWWRRSECRILANILQFILE